MITTETTTRPSLECPLCGSEAILADDDGLFWETPGVRPCLSCQYPGRVFVEDGLFEDEPAEAHWREADENHRAVAEWRSKYPVQAAELDGPTGYVSTLPKAATA